MCRACGFSGYGQVTSRVSTGGWILFIFLTLACVTIPFCWIPLVTMKDKRVACPNCGGSTARSGPPAGREDLAGVRA